MEQTKSTKEKEERLMEGKRKLETWLETSNNLYIKRDKLPGLLHVVIHVFNNFYLNRNNTIKIEKNDKKIFSKNILNS